MTAFKNKLQNYYFYLYLTIYSIINLITLTAFPFIHSDEAWLAGLTNEYIKQKTIFVSESFFDLMPRTIHTIKSFYHLLQVPFVAFFGNTPYSARLLSLIAAIITLYFFHQLLISLNIHPYRAIMYTIIFSLNLQFVYASHFGRQEMVLLMMLTICLYHYYKNKSVYTLAILLGLSIGFHPNAFIITAMIGIILFKDLFTTDRMTLKKLLTFVAIVGAFAAVHVAVTLIANPQFISQYWAYGQTLDVGAAPAGRLINFKDFYLKLYYQVSGTYYIPPIQSLYIIGGLLSMLTLIYGLSKKLTHSNRIIQVLIDMPVMLIGYNVAIFIIGRFNTTSITFALLPLYLLILLIIETIYLFRHSIEARLHNQGFAYIFYGLITIIALTSLQSLTNEYSQTANHNYNEYLTAINEHIDDDAIVLGNLSSGYIFHDKDFYDIRNLAFIGLSTTTSSDTSIEDYIANRNIDTIVYYEEYDYIHRNQQWEILYGDDEAWYDDLQIFLNEKATLTYEFDNAYYGSRIIRFLGDYPWKVYIYKVN